MKKEIEVKFKIDNIDNIKKQIIDFGAHFGDSYKQTTYGFFSDNSVEKGIFPRIRDEDNDIVLTVKVRPKEQTNYFERDEYSMKIPNLKEGEEILKALGFNNIKIFEKLRQECEFLNTKISLDKLYFGDFIEIEGEKNDIESVINKLNLSSEERIIRSYLRLEEDYKKRK
ncbi:class IV adenylate cyclase [bacterium]|jgi:predicted adenylyl cyclase CyaB|nr:class IV adenylate cyclase [bacterium]